MEQLNNLETTILSILSGHKGRESAVSRSQLLQRVDDHCPLFPVADREVRKIIKHLVESHGYWIGSCGKGYFMIETDEELLAACKYYHGYAMSLLHVEAKLRKMSLPALLGQLSLELKQLSSE